MGYFNQILYILRQLFKFKIIGIFLLIMFSLIVFCLALSTDVKAITQEDLADISWLYEDLQEKIYTDYNVTITENDFAMVFCDYNTMTYNVLYVPSSSLSNIGFGQNNMYFIMWVNGVTVYCYRYSFTLETTSSNGYTVATPVIRSSLR